MNLKQKIDKTDKIREKRAKKLTLLSNSINEIQKLELFLKQLQISTDIEIGVTPESELNQDLDYYVMSQRTDDPKIMQKLLDIIIKNINDKISEANEKIEYLLSELKVDIP